MMACCLSNAKRFYEPNWSWLIVNKTLTNWLKLQSKFKFIFIMTFNSLTYTFGNVCEMQAILSCLRCLHMVRYVRNPLTRNTEPKRVCTKRVPISRRCNFDRICHYKHALDFCCDLFYLITLPVSCIHALCYPYTPLLRHWHPGAPFTNIV